MTENSSGLRVLDLYSGAGGFSEGFRQAGFDIVAGIDNWKPARDSHHINGLGEAIDFDMMVAIDEGGYEVVKQQVAGIERKYGQIDVLIGSPPCTEFSYAKKGGKGDIAHGMLLVRAFLVYAAALKPKFWFMENVPRLEQAIMKESEKSIGQGWAVSLAQLGISNHFENIPWVKDDYLHIPYGKILLASDFGAPQNRYRFIAGNFSPQDISQQKVESAKTMGEILEHLEQSFKSKGLWVTDPNYPYYKIKKKNFRDYGYDTRLHPMYWEEMRFLKRRHIQYGRMAFPDDLNRTARTIMATYNPASREAITLDTGETQYYQGKKRPVYRQPTVREVACLQGFPISFQFNGSNITTRYKLVGNAVPCQLAYALALTVLNRLENNNIEEKGWEERFQETLRRRKTNHFRPIIKKPLMILDEVDEKYQKAKPFTANPEKHIRRKILSSKPFNTSVIVIMENTTWIEENEKTNRIGKIWKSSIQAGVGKGFSQVYLDDKSVQILLDALDSSPHVGQWHPRQQLIPIDRNIFTRQIVADLISEIDKGFPQVKEDWIEFPGYTNSDSEKYRTKITKKRLNLPSASYFQHLFTHDEPEIGDLIGPIDIFDALDALMLLHLSKKETSWILNISIAVEHLHDRGEALYKRRITKLAEPSISGDFPLVSIISALLSVHIIFRMYCQEEIKHPFIESLKSAWKKIQAWCKNRE